MNAKELIEYALLDARTDDEKAQIVKELIDDYHLETKVLELLGQDPEAEKMEPFYDDDVPF